MPKEKPKSFSEMKEAGKKSAQREDLDFDVSGAVPSSAAPPPQHDEEEREEDDEGGEYISAFEKKLEASLPPLRLDEYISQSRVQQEIPILNGKMKVELCSLTGEDSEFVARAAFDMQEEKYSTLHAMNEIALLSLTLGLVSIDGVKFPSCRDSSGTPKPEEVMKKLSRLKRYGTHLIDTLVKHFNYFNNRVARLFDEEEVKKA